MALAGPMACSNSVICFSSNPHLLMGGTPLSLTQCTELKAALLAPDRRLLLQHYCIRKVPGIAIGAVDHFVLRLDQLRDVLVEERWLHQLLQDVSIHWHFAARALDFLLYHCSNV